MSNTQKENTEAQLWSELKDVRAVMLGCANDGKHMQPMAPCVDDENKTIWFFTRKDTDLAKATGTGSSGTLCLIGSDRDFHACLAGNLSVQKHDEVIERFWSPVVAAWFEGGKDDPDLKLLKFEPSTASVWSSTDSSVKFGWEIAKANLTGSEPDVGYHKVLQIGGGLAA